MAERKGGRPPRRRRKKIQAAAAGKDLTNKTVSFSGVAFGPHVSSISSGAVLVEAITPDAAAIALGWRPEPAALENGELAVLVESPASKRKKQTTEDVTARGATRSQWLKPRLDDRGWSLLDLAQCGGPAYNTIRRYLSGKTSNQDSYVRKRIARALSCLVSDVPE